MLGLHKSGKNQT